MFEGDQPDLGNGKVILPFKWRDEEGSLDLSDPNDLEKAKRLVNQGYGYEKGQVELKAVKSEADELKTQIEYWNGIIKEAKETGDTSRVVGALEMEGVKLSQKQSDDDNLVIDESDKKFDEMTKKLDRLETALYQKYTGDIHTQLEAKYSKDSGYPEYNKKEIENFADKKGIRDFEDAYFIMNRDKIQEAQEKIKNNESNKHKSKIKKVASDPPGGGDLPPAPIKHHKNYGDVTKEWLKDSEIAGNLFLDE